MIVVTINISPSNLTLALASLAASASAAMALCNCTGSLASFLIREWMFSDGIRNIYISTLSTLIPQDTVASSRTTWKRMNISQWNYFFSYFLVAKATLELEARVTESVTIFNIIHDVILMSVKPRKTNLSQLYFALFSIKILPALSRRCSPCCWVSRRGPWCRGCSWGWSGPAASCWSERPPRLPR